MLLLGLFLLLPVTVAAQCDPGWSHFNGSCYKHVVDFQKRVTWYKAEQLCASAGGHLAWVESEAELNFIADLSMRYGSLSSTQDAIHTAINTSLMNLNQRKQFYNFPLLGANRLNSSTNAYSWPHSASTFFSWCTERNETEGLVVQPSLGAREWCTSLKNFDPPCMYDNYCENAPNYSRFICRRAALPQAPLLGCPPCPVCSSGAAQPVVPVAPLYAPPCP